MKFKYFVYIFFFFLLVAVFIVYNKRDLGLKKSNSTYSFSKLDPKVAAQVYLRKDLMVDGKPFLVLFEDILDEHYVSLVQKKDELLILAAIEQHVKPSDQKIVFGAKKPKRPLSEICNQFQVNCVDESRISFDDKQPSFLKTDRGPFHMSQIDVSGLQMRAAQSEVLNYLLEKISQKISQRVTYLIAKQQNLTAQEFIEKYIVSMARLKQIVTASLASSDFSTEEKKRLEPILMSQKRQELIDKYLLQHFVQKPIIVNIQQPQFNFETRWDWTPFFGIAPRDNSLHVIFFADFLSDASRKVIQLMLKQQDQKREATFGFRPLFSSQDAMQRMIVEVSFCAWLQDKSSFWKLLARFIKLHKDFTESDLYELAQQENLNVAELKQCFLQRKTKEAVDYHLQSARYLRIINPPVVYIGNEVHIGPISENDFERIFDRQ